MSRRRTAREESEYQRRQRGIQDGNSGQRQEGNGGHREM